MSDNTPAEPAFTAPKTLLEALVNTMKRGRVLRQISQIIGKQRGRQALGYGAKLRMRRMDWIRESQEQGVAVALARKEARKNGTMVEHLNHYYPMHRHVRRA
jgi:hypothetical protein